MYTRTRSTLAVATAVTGALALSVLTVPAAQADIVYGDTRISSVVVNGGKPIVLGVSGRTPVTVKMTVSDPKGISDAGGILYHGTNISRNDWGVILPICGKHAVPVYTCTLNDTFDAIKNAHAGTWKMWAYANGMDGHYIQKDPALTFKVLRATKLTVNAAPEPVKKGKPITVTGSLTVANWETHKAVGYGSQKVVLQFRKAGTTKYVNVKTITSSSKGALKTTVGASADGYWRLAYAGTTSTAAATAAADYVDVR
ncbi:calcium-binding protein [Streptomyces sp. GMY02]|uniref:calcium-binding protein n=1 Tax=Streptomyces sp. GMY02 TaxID=1333528 RepID=UPI001C2BA1C7|nr:calcium-binding protein [Streptomyces sp. GMY02]QXE38651.1 calcium-binding protein [Streptomyces sp. GMY02]